RPIPPGRPARGARRGVCRSGEAEDEPRGEPGEQQVEIAPDRLAEAPLAGWLPTKRRLAEDARGGEREGEGGAGERGAEGPAEEMERERQGDEEELRRALALGALEEHRGHGDPERARERGHHEPDQRGGGEGEGERGELVRKLPAKRLRRPVGVLSFAE